ncbi:MAG: alginate O-acetyltransferase [Clostridiales bacterium GWB2_37_7]|nr:MAG: alginate O-acetyltransferase [Clostridiales bacterium GWB2_37_7]
MLFSSLMFIFVFLPTVIFLYYISPAKLKNFVLLIFSLFFYGYGEPKSLFIMLLSISMNYLFGLLVDKYRSSKTQAYTILTLSAIGNLSIIGYYKYTDFFIENFNALFGLSVPLLHVIMPIGISFFTFQGMSYVIDVYRAQGKAQKNPLNVALYISLFPQLIAGPIVRYQTVAEQINERHVDLDKFASGIEKFILGLSKKVLIANSMGLIADEVFAFPTSQLSVLLSWVGVLAYTAQIYFDFSGYSDMAIGLGRMFGFEFFENFNYPYISKSITEFWRRWHISLCSWFRDYVYIPLGGNRASRSKLIRNIMIVWLLTGLWHGAAWNFIVWGLYFALLLLLEKFLIGRFLQKLWLPLQHLYALLFIVLGWLWFRAESLSYAIGYLTSMLGLGGQPIISTQALYYIVEYKFEFIAAIVASMPIYPLLQAKLKNSGIGLFLNYYIKYLVLIVLFGLCIMYLLNSTFNPFIYFRF